MKSCVRFLTFILILPILIFTVLLLVPDVTYSAITGVCSTCHTMHNSFQGQPMAKYSNGTSKPTPNPVLLITDCIGCHSGPVGDKSTYGAPIVYHTSNPGGTGPGKTLAGGDFYWVAQSGGDRKGHNVAGLANQDALLGFTPPGWDPNATAGTKHVVAPSGWTQQLTCYGTYGCHGWSDGINYGLKGHHSNLSGALTSSDIGDASSVGASYRFLLGIWGYESSDWQWNATSATHNEYYGVNGNTNYSNKHTISYLCAECHGVFHSQAGGSSPWFRHPTDIVLPGTGEYANYNNGSGYSLASPVARPAIGSSSSSTVTPGDASTSNGAIVMCLSCHRAHGSEYDSILRWEYSNATQAGCKVCHTSK
ncbi:MAG: cytochrome c3 family protein [Thermosulfidibacteraceae bacterium]